MEIEQRKTLVGWIERVLWAGILTFLLAAVLGFAYMGGVIGAGSRHWVLLLMFVGLPAVVIFCTLTLIAAFGGIRPGHCLAGAAAMIGVLVLYAQPWNPRAQFVSALQSISAGATPDEVKRHMNGYLGGTYGVCEELYVPEQFKNLGITHSASYRWNDTDGRFNADVGHVYFRKGAVVATDFSPD